MPIILSEPDPYAEVGDVEDRWRQLSQDEADRAQALLADATLILNATYPALPGIVAATGVPPVATMVVANMVRRALVAPAAGYVGDAPGAVTPASYADVGGNLYLLAAERSLLTAATSVGQGWRAPAYTVSLSG